MYLHTHTHTHTHTHHPHFPNILVQDMSCSIATAIANISTHTNLISLIFSFKQKFRKFPQEKL